jgi:hypothetical protein
VPPTGSRAGDPGAGGGGAAWCALAASGIAFWFLVGFPFAHHNESYEWVSWIGTPDWASAAWHGSWGPASRPLALSLAWALYKVGDGSLVPIQLFNFALAVLAWWTLCRAAVCRRTFALAALVGGGVFFAGYIFLFHLHGVFYGPLLLWLAAAVRACEGTPTPRTLVLVFASAVVAALSHPFALVLCLALIVGTLLERGWLVRRGVLAFALIAGVLGTVLIVRAAPSDLLSASGRGLRSLFSSFRAVEVNRVVSAVAALFALATVASTRWPGRRWAQGALVATFAGAVALLSAGLPLTFLWLVVGGIKAAVHRRWGLLLMLAASLGLPYVGFSGSPTYVVFALALLTYLVAVDAALFERVLAGLRPAHALGASGLLVVGALLVRSGRDVPLLSVLARPVLAEKERTHQAERLLRDILASPWRRHPVRLAEDARAPIELRGAIDRRQRAPTQQVALDAYLRHVRGPEDPGATPIVLSFGASQVPGRRLFLVPGRYAGEAVASVATASADSAGMAPQTGVP